MPEHLLEKPKSFISSQPRAVETPLGLPGPLLFLGRFAPQSQTWAVALEVGYLDLRLSGSGGVWFLVCNCNPDACLLSQFRKRTLQQGLGDFSLWGLFAGEASGQMSPELWLGVRHWGISPEVSWFISSMSVY